VAGVFEGAPTSPGRVNDRPWTAGGYTPPVNQIRCSQCGTVDLEPGFVSDTGQGARGFAQWVVGPIETGLMGLARRRGRRHMRISAFRCPTCTHLELFAAEPS
jgi:hypothetical protein